MGSVFIAGRLINEKMCHLCQNFFSIRSDSLEKQGNIEYTLNDLIQKITRILSDLLHYSSLLIHPAHF